MDDNETQSGGSNTSSNAMGQPESSASSSPSDHYEPIIHQPVPTRQRLPSCKNSGPLVVTCDSSGVGPVEPHFGLDDRAISPRRTSEEIAKVGKEAREELRRHAKAMRESLITIFNCVEVMRVEHDKMDSNNKFLKKYIGDLMNTTKIAASDNRDRQ